MGLRPILHLPSSRDCRSGAPTPTACSSGRRLRQCSRRRLRADRCMTCTQSACAHLLQAGWTASAWARRWARWSSSTMIARRASSHSRSRCARRRHPSTSPLLPRSPRAHVAQAACSSRAQTARARYSCGARLMATPSSQAAASSPKMSRAPACACVSSSSWEPTPTASCACTMRTRAPSLRESRRTRAGSTRSRYTRPNLPSPRPRRTRTSVSGTLRRRLTASPSRTRASGRCRTRSYVALPSSGKAARLSRPAPTIPMCCTRGACRKRSPTCILSAAQHTAGTLGSGRVRDPVQCTCRLLICETLTAP
mmetsp:Transcript_11130/g.28966  ORF Transcript_11130/g.28966 Transcript_11130/m.28966 type:complete len:310 (-) Transcript_11130:145-1074(-)